MKTRITFKPIRKKLLSFDKYIKKVKLLFFGLPFLMMLLGLCLAVVVLLLVILDRANMLYILIPVGITLILQLIYVYLNSEERVMSAPHIEMVKNDPDYTIKSYTHYFQMFASHNTNAGVYEYKEEKHIVIPLVEFNFYDIMPEVNAVYILFNKKTQKEYMVDIAINLNKAMDELYTELEDNLFGIEQAFGEENLEAEDLAVRLLWTPNLNTDLFSIVKHYNLEVEPLADHYAKNWHFLYIVIYYICKGRNISTDTYCIDG